MIYSKCQPSLPQYHHIRIVLEESLGIEVKKELLPLQPGDVPDTYADVDDLVKEFGYKPSMTVKEGVKSFAEWYKGYHNI